MQRFLQSILIAIVSGVIGCTPETDKYHQTLDILSSFNPSIYHNLSEEDRSEYLKKNFTDYHLRVTDVIVEWKLPFTAGEVNEKLYSDIVDLTLNQPIIFFSGGGEERYSDKIANFIIDNKIDLIVPYFCASACAEDILPAANKLFFLMSL